MWALGEATGVSGGSALTIPALLLPDRTNGSCLTDLAKARRIEDADIGKVGCYRVRGTWVDDPATIWIEKNTFLVRRIDSQHKFDDFRTEDTTTYDPVMNSKIDDKMLKLDPPKQE